MLEIPKTIIVERIRSRGGSEMAERADEELPEKLDPDSDTELLRKYGLDPGDLRDEFRGQSPVAG
jgi:hypothetical protein